MADEVRPIRRVVRETTHVGHAGTATDRAGIHIGRCGVEQNAGPPLCVVSRHHPPNRPDFVRHLAILPLVGCES